jgi:AcrR family transcriptional regulator
VGVTERSDAQRNRARLIAAARALLERGGVDISVRAIAREAGVGVGTVYRHFPTRDDLVDAVLEDAVEEIVAVAGRALEEDDARMGFTRFIEETIALGARNRGLKDVLETEQHGRTRAAAMRRRIRPAIAQLVERAQAQGTLRADVVPQDVALVFWGSDRVMELAADVAPEVWRRHLALVFDGLRAGAATPLPEPPLTETKLHRVGRTR